MYLPMKTKHAAGYLVIMSCIAIALAFVILSNGSNALAQQQTNNNTYKWCDDGTDAKWSTNVESKFYENEYNELNSSVSLFSPMIDAIKSKIHTTLNDATTNALKAVGGGSNSSAVCSVHSPGKRISSI